MSFNRYAFMFLLLALPGCARFQDRKLEPEKTLSAYENRSLENSRLQSFLATNQIPPLADWKPPEKWDLDTLTLVGFFYHPSLDVARAQWSTAKAAVRTAGGRPNPTIGLLPGYDFNAANGLSPWIPEMTFDLPIETAGKRGHRIHRAEQLSTAARLNILSTAWQVRSALRTGLLNFLAARLREQALEAQLQSEQTILQLMEQRLQAGAVASTDLFPARVDVLRTRSDLIDLKRQQAEARAGVANALGVPLKAIESLQFDFPLELPGNWSDLSSTEIRRGALRGRADLLAGLADYEASQAALQLEIARQYPDVHLGSTYQWDQGENKWLAGVTFELPVLNRNQGPIAEALAKREETAARFTALQAKVIAEIDRALAARTAALDQVSRQEQFTRLARERAASVENLFKAGAADKLELSSAQLEASVSGLASLDAQARAQQALAQLEEAIQRPLESWPALEEGRERAKAP